MARFRFCYMKGLILWIFFFIPRLAYSAPTYGTEMPHKGKILIGYQSNSVFKHDLADTYGNIKSDQHFYDMSYGVYDWLSVDGKAGIGDILQKGGIHPKVHYGYGFAGGYGFRVRVLHNEADKVMVVAGFHHISVHPANAELDNNKYESLSDDWQCSVVSSKEIGRFNPFLGVKLSRFDLVYKVNEIDRKRRPPLYYAGLIAGCSVRLAKDMSLSVEGHFIDESSLSAGIHYAY